MESILRVVSAAPKLLIPLKQHSVSDARVRDDATTWEEHLTKCGGGGGQCSQCVFYRGMMGMLRKGHGAGPPDDDKAWWHRLTFNYRGKKEIAICERPSSWGGPWAIGCFVCNVYSTKHINTFATCDVRGKKMMEIHKLLEHCKNHTAALERLKETEEAVGPDVEYAASGLRDDVPRLDTFVRAGVSVEACLSDCDFSRIASSSAIGSVLAQGGDESKQIAPQCVRSIAMPIHELDQLCLSRCTLASITIDEGEGVMFAHTRLFLPEGKIYDMCLGVLRDYGTDSTACVKTLSAIIDEACTVRKGRRATVGRRDVGPEDKICTAMRKNYCERVVHSVSDAGPAEMKGLWKASALMTLSQREGAPILFHNLNEIVREKPHRWRSVQKGWWAAMDAVIQDFLDILVSGPQSVASMIQTSKKYRGYFIQAQSTENPDDFVHFLRNLSYQDCRFNSRSEPLYRIYRVLPSIVEAARLLTRHGDPGDVRWAVNVLNNFDGVEGYDRVVSTAVIACAMVEMQTAIRLEEPNDADIAMSPTIAAQVRDRARVLFHEGAIFLEEAKGTLAHYAISLYQSKKLVVYTSTDATQKSVSLAWPAPGTVELRKPIVRAQEAFKTFDAFFQANFPFFEDSNMWSAFDLGLQLSSEERMVMVRGLAVRFGVDVDRIMVSFPQCLRVAHWFDSAAGSTAATGLGI